MNIAEQLLRSLEAHGVGHLFGNPGTTEIPLVRACERRDRLRYVVALSEVSAVPMADGYARATRGLGAVNLHVAPGLGNGLGTLYTAAVAKTPLLVLVGGQDRRLLHTGPILHGPLEEMARPAVKAVATLTDAASADFRVRQAIRTAITAPTGPVALVCPPDLLEAPAEGEAATAVTAPRLGALAPADVERYAAFLQRARTPALVAAEDVHWAGAADALRGLAERLGAAVYASPYTAVVPIDTRSPSYAGYLSPSFKAIGERLAAHDAVLFVGFRNLRTTLHSVPSLPRSKAWIGHDPAAFSAEGEFEIARIADLRESLEAIAAALPGAPAAGRRWTSPVEIPPAEAGRFHPTRAVAALLAAYPDALVVDEAGLSTSDVRALVGTAAGNYLINGSGGIGWGLAAAVGVAIGRPGHPVLAIVGDGSALYASEALWTAQHQGTKVLFVILANRRYATLNEAARRLTGQPLDLFSLEPPVLAFGGLATLYGLDYACVADEAELLAFLAARRLGLDRNTLLELRLDPSVHPAGASRHF